MFAIGQRTHTSKERLNIFDMNADTNHQYPPLIIISNIFTKINVRNIKYVVIVLLQIIPTSPLSLLKVPEIKKEPYYTIGSCTNCAE